MIVQIIIECVQTYIAMINLNNYIVCGPDEINVGVRSLKTKNTHFAFFPCYVHTYNLLREYVNVKCMYCLHCI